MTLAEFLEKVIDEGIKAAKRDYSGDDKKAKLAGAVAGFESCRGKSVEAILLLEKQAHEASREMFDLARNDPDGYWAQRCREMEITWVVNCLGAAMIRMGKEHLGKTTLRGMQATAEILGDQEVTA